MEEETYDIDDPAVSPRVRFCARRFAPSVRYVTPIADGYVVGDYEHPVIGLVVVDEVTYEISDPAVPSWVRERAHALSTPVRHATALSAGEYLLTGEDGGVVAVVAPT